MHLAHQGKGLVHELDLLLDGQRCADLIEHLLLGEKALAQRPSAKLGEWLGRSRFRHS